MIFPDLLWNTAKYDETYFGPKRISDFGLYISGHTNWRAHRRIRTNLAAEGMPKVSKSLYNWIIRSAFVQKRHFVNPPEQKNRKKPEPLERQENQAFQGIVSSIWSKKSKKWEKGEKYHRKGSEMLSQMTKKAFNIPYSLLKPIPMKIYQLLPAFLESNGKVRENGKMW